MQIKIKNNLEELSSYDKAMEDFVSTKKDRIIEVFPVEIQGETYYKCKELEYWYFTEQMIEERLPEKFKLVNLIDIKDINSSRIATFSLDKQVIENYSSYGATIGIMKDGTFWIDLSKDIESEAVSEFIETHFKNPIQTFLLIQKAK